MLGAAGAVTGSPTTPPNSLGEFQWAKCEGVSLACVHARNNGSLGQLLALLSYRKNVTKFRVRGPIQGLFRSINLHIFRLIEYISGHSFQFDCVPNAAFFGGQCLACRKCTFEFEYIVFDEAQDTWAALVTLNQDLSSACQPSIYHRNLTSQARVISSQLESLPSIMLESELQRSLHAFPYNNSRKTSIFFGYPHGDIKRSLLSSLHHAGFVAQTKIGSLSGEPLECPPRFSYLRRPRISRHLGTLMIIPVCRPGHNLSYFLSFANADAPPLSHALPLISWAPSSRIFEIKEPVAQLTSKTPALLRSPPPRTVIDLLTDGLNEDDLRPTSKTSAVVDSHEIDLICFSSSDDENIEARPRPKIVYKYRAKSIEQSPIPKTHPNSLLDSFECPAPTTMEPESINPPQLAQEVLNGNNVDNNPSLTPPCLPNNGSPIASGPSVDPVGSDPSSVDESEVFVVKRARLSTNLALICSETDNVSLVASQLPLSPTESSTTNDALSANESNPIYTPQNQGLSLPASSSSVKVGEVSVPMIALPKDDVLPPQNYWLRDPINKQSGDHRILEFVPPDSDHVDVSRLQELYPLTCFVIKDSLLVADVEKTALEKLKIADLSLMQARLLINGLEKLVPSAMEENALFRMVLVQNIQELTKQQYQALIGVASSVGRIDSVYRLLLLYINHKKSHCQCISPSKSGSKSIKDLFWTTDDYLLLDSLRDVHQGEVDYCLAARSMNNKPCLMIRFVFETTYALDRSLKLFSKTSTECRCDSCDLDSCPCLKVFSECDPNLCGCCSRHDTKKLCQQLSNDDCVSIVIRPSPLHGWGCFAEEIIEVGQLIMEYCGEIISSAEARRRALWYDMKTGGGNYIFALNDDYLIDAAFVGSDVRFCNHAPSTIANAQAIGKLRVGIYAKQRISPGEEITFDYGDHYTPLDRSK